VLPHSEQMELIRRGIEEIVPDEELDKAVAKAVETDTPLRVKYGIDPTGKDVHIGHMVPVSKVRDFQDAGHLGVIIIGDYTAQIGDPTGKEESRPPLTMEEVHANAETYVVQLMKVLDPDKTEVRYQAEWFENFSLVDMIHLGQKFTLAQMLAHDTFSKRLEEGSPLAIHEILYPMLMAYDSVAIRADVELGGMEQKFNILQGRDLQRDSGQRPQIAALMPMLPGLDGGAKMGKSLGNYLGVNDEPTDMFGKIMSIRDDLLVDYFALAAGASPSVVEEVRRKVDGTLHGDDGEQVNPMDLKRQLAGAIVTRYHDAGAARNAEEEFMGVFSRKDQLPDDMPEVSIAAEEIGILDLIVNASLAPSRSEARRLVGQGGVSIDGEKISDPKARVEPPDGAVLRVGKRRFGKIRLR
jgi:tyrosyl-tRNA synthetase